MMNHIFLIILTIFLMAVIEGIFLITLKLISIKITYNFISANNYHITPYTSKKRQHYFKNIENFNDFFNIDGDFGKRIQPKNHFQFNKHFITPSKIDIPRKKSVTHFSYDENELNGPLNWKYISSTCGGLNQSPIHLNESDFKYNHNYKNLKFKNFAIPPLTTTIANDGHTVRISFQWDEDFPTIRGGPLQTEYKLAEIHFHWGLNNRLVIFIFIVIK